MNKQTLLTAASLGASLLLSAAFAYFLNASLDAQTAAALKAELPLSSAAPFLGMAALLTAYFSLRRFIKNILTNKKISGKYIYI